MPDSHPVFIVGAPRSGTTFLATLLDAHHRIRMGQELWVLRVRDELQEVLARRSRIGFGAGAGRWSAAMADTMLDQLIQAELSRTGKQRFGDKKPAYAKRIPSLTERFPTARILHIVRDGRDVCASMLVRQEVDPRWRGAPWAPTTWRQAATQWVEFASAALRDGSELPDEQYHQLSYEQLSEDPQRTGEELLAFLGERSDVAFERVLSGFAPRSRPWQDKLSPAACAAVASTEGFEELLAELGYPPTPRAIEAPPAEAETVSSSAEARVAAGDLEGARELLERAMARLGEHPLLCSDLAVVAHAQGRIAEAERLLLAAVRSEPTPPAAVANLLALDLHVEEALKRAGAVGGPQIQGAVCDWLCRRGLHRRTAAVVARQLI